MKLKKLSSLDGESPASPYKIKYRVYVSCCGCEIETWFDDYQSAIDSLEKFKNKHGLRRIEVAIVGPADIIDNGDDTVLCKANIIDVMI